MKYDIAVKIGKNIRAIRQKLNLTQDGFAEKIEIKRSLLGAYEEGRAEPGIGTLQKIAWIGGVSVDELFSDLPIHHTEGSKV